MNRLLATIQSQEIWQQASDESFSFRAGMTIDADGSPRAYGPRDSGLDYTINAGHPGNWWGVVTGRVNTLQSDGRVITDIAPVVQGPQDPCPGMYISTTSLQNRARRDDGSLLYGPTDPRRYVNSEEIPFVVCPGIVAKNASGIVLGCKVVVVDTRSGEQCLAVCADIGPSTHLGECSMKLAAIMGVRNSPRDGGETTPCFRYTFYPGQAAKGYTLQPLG